MPTPTFDEFVALITDIRPDLDAADITPESIGGDDLGLDSLDMIQLSRQLRKNYQVQLDFETWRYKQEPISSFATHVTALDA